MYAIMIAIPIILSILSAFLLSVGKQILTLVGVGVDVMYFMEQNRLIFFLISIVPLFIYVIILRNKAFSPRRLILLVSTLLLIILTFTVGVIFIRPSTVLPSLDHPIVITAEESTLENDDFIMGIVVNGEARAYPLTILELHSVSNDEVAGVPIVISFCPFCNTGVAFSPIVDGEKLIFNVESLNRNNLVISDEQTKSWWQQITGEAIKGSLTGTRLNPIPVSHTTWGEWKVLHPGTLIVSKDTGFGFKYKEKPEDFEGIGRFQKIQFEDDRLEEEDNVLGVILSDTAKAYSFDSLTDVQVVNDTIETTDLVVFFNSESQQGTAFESTIEGKTLTFEKLDRTGEGGAILFKDNESSSVWNINGEAIEGTFVGRTLERIPAIQSFWFAWADFHQETLLYQPSNF